MRRSFDELNRYIIETPLALLHRLQRLAAIHQRSNSEQRTQEEKNPAAILALAISFVTAHAGVPPWENNAIFYEQLAAWLSLHDELEFAVYAWQMRIKLVCSNESELLAITPLITCFFDQPFKIAAYISLLVLTDVKPKDIIYSGVLQNYFEYAIRDNEEIKETYALIKKTCPADDLFRLTRTQQPGSLVFLNAKHPSKPCLQSWNIMGEMFEHRMPLLPYKTRINEAITPGFIILYVLKTQPLFDLFKEEFLRYIDVIAQIPSRIFSQFIVNNFDYFITHLQTHATNKCLSTVAVDAILKIIAAEKSDQSTNEIEALIVAHPFYIFLLPDLEKTYDMDAEIVLNQITLLVDSINYKQPKTISLLCRLYNDLNSYNKHRFAAEKICNYLFFQILQNDALISDEDFTEISEMHDIERLAESEYKKISQDISSKINDHVLEKISYEDVEFFWFGNEQVIRILQEIKPRLKNLYAYPRGRYALIARCVECAWEAKKNTQGFDISKTMEVYCVSKNDDNVIDDIKTTANMSRALKETLLQTRKQELANTLIFALSKNDLLYDFLHEPFGNDSNLFEKTIYELNHFLLPLLLKIKPLTLEREKTYLHYAWQHLNFKAFTLIAEKKCIRAETVEALINSNYLSNETDNNEVKSEKMAADCINLLFSSTTVVKPAKRYINTLVNHAIAKNDNTVFQVLCGFSNLMDNQTQQCAASTAFKKNDSAALFKILKKAKDKQISAIIQETLKNIFQKNSQDFLKDLLREYGSVIHNCDMNDAIKNCYSKIPHDMIFQLCGFKDNLNVVTPAVQKNDFRRYLFIVNLPSQKRLSLTARLALLQFKTTDGHTLLYHFSMQPDPILFGEFYRLLENTVTPRQMFELLNIEIENDDKMKSIFDEKVEELRYLLNPRKRLRAPSPSLFQPSDSDNHSDNEGDSPGAFLQGKQDTTSPSLQP